MSTTRLVTRALLALAVGHNCRATPAQGQGWQETTGDISFRRTYGLAFDFGGGIGSVDYSDSIATIFEGLPRVYAPLGLQFIVKQLFGPVALHEHLDFTWDTFGKEGDDSTGSLTRFSRSISILGATAVHIGNRLQIEPMMGMGWTYIKMKAKRGSTPQFIDTKETRLYSGLVAGGEILARASSKSGVRLLYTHGFFDDPVNRLTVQFGGFWTTDPDYEQLFAGIGIRTAWYGGHIRELILMFDIGGAQGIRP